MRSVLLPIVALSFASCGSAGLPESSPDVAVQAASDCSAALTEGYVDVDKLEALGWEAATLKSDGREMDAPVMFYGNRDGGPMLMLTGEKAEDRRGCVMTAGLESLSNYKAVVTAFENEFTTASKKGNDHFFRNNGDVILLSPTGSPEKPSFRIAIMTLGDSE